MGNGTGSYTAATVTNTTGTEIWLTWNESVTTAATATIWNVWNDNTPITTTTTPTVGGYEVRMGAYLPRVETAEQRAARHAEAARRQQENIRIEGEKRLARQKAQALLDRALSEAQREQLRANGYFDLETISKDGERRRYRIKRGRQGNVHRLDEQGREVRRYCIHPMIQCPDEDTMLTQKLWLENNEELFLRTANAS